MSIMADVYFARFPFGFRCERCDISTGNDWHYNARWIGNKKVQVVQCDYCGKAHYKEGKAQWF